MNSYGNKYKKNQCIPRKQEDHDHTYYCPIHSLYFLINWIGVQKNQN